MTMKIADIEKALASMKREVDDFHLHLREFLPKLEGIQDVEYTHGTQEFGADFVLTKRDNSTGATRYVGVVVKKDKIIQGSVDDVIRQISECAKISRLIGTVSDKIKMSEVWVIVNGSISNNAKEKIHAEHLIGVTFIDRKHLAKLMRDNDYNFGDDLPANISICLTKQSTYAETLKSQSINLGALGIANIFMKQSVIKHNSVQYNREGKRKIKPNIEKKTLQSVINNHHTILLFGGPGSGKSKMLQGILGDNVTVNVFKKTKTIPIYVTCQEILDTPDQKIAQVIDNFEKEHNLSDNTNDLNYMIIIDGIDECGLSWDERLEIIQEWKKESSLDKLQKLIFSSRDSFEGSQLSISKYRIADIQIKDVVKSIKESLSDIDTVDRIISDVVRSDIFRSLPATPLSTVILISLLKDQGGRHELPANLTELFAKYIEICLGRWDKNVKESLKQKRYEAANEILGKIAVYLIDNNIGKLAQSEAKDFFVSYLQERNLKIDENKLFNDVIEHSNLVFVDDGIFQFRHRTFVEFFYSKNFSDKKISKIGEDVFDARWSNILFFYVGLQKDCPDLLQQINSIIPKHEFGKVMKSIGMANILLAGYATPYMYVKEMLRCTFIDISKYLDDVFNRKIENSGLNEHSVMRVLFFFRFVMDYEYSRPFFGQAIEDSLIEIEDLDIEDDVKATALFLLNLPHQSLGGENVFSGMIKKLGDQIPVHIKLAINHETDLLEHYDGNVMKFKKTIRKNLLNKRKTDSVRYLYDKNIQYLPGPKNENQ